MSAGFAHVGPLKPVDVPEDRWAGHPLLRLVHVGDDGVVDWRMPAANGYVHAKRIATLQHVKFTTDGRGERIARIPPRLNHDWFVDDRTDAHAPAPIVGRARDLERFYELSWEAEIHFGFVAARTDDAGVRRYFEWIHGIWVEVPLDRWLTIRDAEAPDELDHRAMTERFPAELAAPRFERSESDPRMTDVDGLVQSARAEAIASIAHRAQTDKLGAAYIDHPARVAGRFDAVDQPIERAAAWLHDVLEDTDLTAGDLLQAGILPEIVEVVAVLTRPGFPWQDGDYSQRVRGNPRALRVKAADLDDNSAPWRTRRLDEATRERLAAKYRASRAALGLDAGEHSAAEATVDSPSDRA
ncbi:hypothetical protein ACDF64_12725 [Agromyces sp. MMS24-JH15]|uniref:hypothetical protein n=1 Tax=Agromyces sp. MMS24-JH15 TaxID=3243765 RepID=UPI00374A5D51